MLHAFDFNFSWLPEGAVDSVVEKIDVLVRDDVASRLTYQMIVLDLAADCESRQNDDGAFLFRIGKEHLVRRYAGYRGASTRIRGGYNG